MDYYATLGITPTASPSKIRKAYKEKALQHHPDRNANKLEEATERFKQVSTAYEILSDPKTREQYDAVSSSLAGGGFDPPHMNMRRAERIFRSFFGGSSPFE